jgi:tripartite-type tricarboxylate transporter receptor subunit TctC
VPTLAERGLPGYDMDDWFGLFAAAGTPDEPMRRMQAAIAKVTSDPAFAATVAPLGMVPVGNSTADFTTWLNTQRELLQKLVRDANISV